MLALALALLLAAASAHAQTAPAPTPTPVSYSGYRVVRVFAAEHQRRTVADLLDRGVVREMLTRRQHADLASAPTDWPDVRAALEAASLNYTLLSDDLGVEIANENPPEDYDEDSDYRIGHRLTWHRYHSLADIESYLEYLSSVYSHLCSIEEIGRSSEGRPIKLLKVSTGGRSVKPAIWIDAGQHGREWIAPAAATFALLQLVEFGGEHADLLAAFDWFVLPVANPDGYEFSRAGDRLWRKTRSGAVTGSRCAGVDPNRNWDFHWAGASTGGRRGWSAACRDDFAGPHAFSEPETRAAADRMLALNGSLALYLSLHAYSQMWLIPWSFQDEKPADYYDLFVLAEEAAAALKAERGTEYLIGTAPELIYPTTGSSDDWAKGVAGAKYAYTVELPDTGKHGFVLPADNIRPVGIETWAGIRTMARRLAQSV